MQPDPNDTRGVMLANFVATGDEGGVRRIIEKDPGAVNELGLDGTSPLCAAALWGHIAILKLLLDAMASPALQNESGPRWTALHAAALQEQGKACMMLLDYKANPTEPDVDGITPCDYASVSEAVWPLFAARGCERTSKAELVRKGVLRKASTQLEQMLEQEKVAVPTDSAEARRGLITEYSRPGSSYVVSREFPPRPGSSAANRPTGRPGTGTGGYGGRPASTTRRQQSRPIDILEEEDSSSVQVSTPAGLRSLAS